MLFANPKQSLLRVFLLTITKHDINNCCLFLFFVALCKQIVQLKQYSVTLQQA